MRKTTIPYKKTNIEEIPEDIKNKAYDIFLNDKINNYDELNEHRNIIEKYEKYCS